MREMLTRFAVSQSSQHIWVGCETGPKIKFANVFAGMVGVSLRAYPGQTQRSAPTADVPG